ncbi:CGNR zinc finger domain-containing protein [Cellulomonas rhizosphaerae]|uniref:CGNR zinc finger domain-containing protein n=1 Tax=Cellulomonas rhizosphaerae TaxID=2293719 RepID=UPI00131449A5|nr:CGNR zinc finger domain-containing protein [Cellulomonas rhizosphaerae]
MTTILVLVPAVKDPLLAWISLGDEPGVAPAPLERVRALLNTDDRFHGIEHLGPEVPREVVGVRDALRAHLLDEGPAELDALATSHPVVVALGAEPRLVPLSATDVVAGLLAEVYEAQRDGSWQRLKACANPDCQWIYYDASRNRSGRWCSMGECGDVMKARAYRERGRRA